MSTPVLSLISVLMTRYRDKHAIEFLSDRIREDAGIPPRRGPFDYWKV